MTDYMSGHPLPETGTDRLETYVIATVQSEHPVVMDKMKEETAKDRELTKLAAAMQTDKWIKTDPDLKPYFNLRAELYTADGLILRIDRIIPPESLRDKIIQIAHKQRHLGISKTKEMLCRKVLVSRQKNHRIDTVVSTCFNCQIATNTQHTEPAKMTKLPERPWETIEIDFCGPFPSKEYALVITDQYTRYPEVEFVYSTAIKPVRKKMKKSSPLTEFPRLSNQTMDHHLTPMTSKSLQRKWGSHTKKSHHDIPKRKWKASTSS